MPRPMRDFGSGQAPRRSCRQPQELDEDPMADRPPIRVAVSGAVGRIAYSLVFRIAGGGMFGPQQPFSLRLLDVPEAADPLRACELELRDCAPVLLADLLSTTDPRRAFEGADWIILLGG